MILCGHGISPNFGTAPSCDESLAPAQLAETAVARQATTHERASGNNRQAGIVKLSTWKPSVSEIFLIRRASGALEIAARARGEAAGPAGGSESPQTFPPSCCLELDRD